MSRIESFTHQHSPLFAHKKEHHPGLWDPLTDLFKKKVPSVSSAESAGVTTPPSEAISPPVIEHSQGPKPSVDIPDGVSVLDVSSTSHTLVAPPSFLDNVEIHLQAGIENTMQIAEQGAIAGSAPTSELSIAAGVTVLSPIEDPATLPLSFSRKVYAIITSGAFTYLALLVTVIAFIYLFYTKIWQKKTIAIEEREPPQAIEPPQTEEINEKSFQPPAETISLQVGETTSPETAHEAMKPEYYWFNYGSGVVGGIIGGILSCVLAKFIERKNAEDDQQKIALQIKAMNQKIQEVLTHLDQIQQTLPQYAQKQQLESALQALRAECLKLTANTDTSSVQLQSFADTLDQLKQRIATLESSDDVRKLRTEFQALIDQYKKESQQRESAMEQLRAEMGCLARKVESAGDDKSVQEDLQKLQIQLDAYMRSSVDLQKLLDKFEQLKAQVDATNVRDMIAQLRQEINGQLQEEILQIRKEFQQRVLKIGNQQESLDLSRALTELSIKVEQNLAFGNIQFDEIRQLLRMLNLSCAAGNEQTRGLCETSLKEQNARIDSLQDKISESIERGLQDRFTQLKTILDEKMAATQGAQSQEIHALRTELGNIPLILNQANADQIESIVERIARLEQRAGNNDEGGAYEEMRQCIGEMKAAALESKRLHTALGIQEERMERGLVTSSDETTRDLLHLINKEKIDVVKRMIALEKSLHEINGGLSKLQIRHTNLDERFMRTNRLELPSHTSPDKLLHTVAAAAVSSDQNIFRQLMSNLEVEALIDRKLREQMLLMGLISSDNSGTPQKDSSSTSQERQYETWIPKDSLSNEYYPVSHPDIKRYLNETSTQTYGQKTIHGVMYIPQNMRQKLLDDYKKRHEVINGARNSPQPHQPMTRGAGDHGTAVRSYSGLFPPPTPPRWPAVTTPSPSPLPNKPVALLLNTPLKFV